MTARRRHPERVILWIAGVLALLGGLTAIGLVQHASARSSADVMAAAQGAFYVPPAVLPDQPGTLIRYEPLTASGALVDVPDAQAWRILYTTTRPDGSIAAASAMVFVPSSAPPATGRPLLAWAHGTIGMGEQCAPSRTADPTKPIRTWLPIALSSGWTVVATDYAGLGTPGHELYLVGSAEAADVTFSVLAARELPDTFPGDRWAVLGHSQGGHAALWSGQLGPAMAPDLDLVAVAALAPAAELPLIITAQWQTLVSWVIGPEVQESWPRVDPELSAAALTSIGAAQTERLAEACVGDAALAAAARQALGQRYYVANPLTDPAWSAMATAQVPAPLHPTTPVFLGQSTTDNVVLAWPNATLQRDWCAAGSNLTATWVTGVSHMDTGLVVGPTAVQWLTNRLSDPQGTSTCNTPPPVSAPQGS